MTTSNGPVESGFTVREPRSVAEWEATYDLRWRILRAPWGQPRGSERDALERGAVHRIAVCAGDGAVVGVGRLHFNTPDEAQVRGMAVEEGFRGRGLGAAILAALESEAARRGVRRVVLNARESAVEFYQREGYRVLAPGELLFGVIPHSRMAKEVGMAGER